MMRLKVFGALPIQPKCGRTDTQMDDQTDGHTDNMIAVGHRLLSVALNKLAWIIIIHLTSYIRNSLSET